MGAIAALQNIATPVSVAAKVCAMHSVAVTPTVSQMLDHSRHSLLSGQGANAFARTLGFTETDISTAESRAAYQVSYCIIRLTCRLITVQKYASDHKPVPSHDTVSLIARDVAGHVASGVSTSGAAFKWPGRIGDSPICGDHTPHERHDLVMRGQGAATMRTTRRAWLQPPGTATTSCGTA